jgi:hypothetical protein
VGGGGGVLSSHFCQSQKVKRAVHQMKPNESFGPPPLPADRVDNTEYRVQGNYGMKLNQALFNTSEKELIWDTFAIVSDLRLTLTSATNLTKFGHKFVINRAQMNTIYSRTSIRGQP